MIISIQGNISSGKTTFISHLKEYYKNNPDVLFVDEPVSTWLTITDTAGENILSKFYKDKKRYAFSFQMVAYITRLTLLKKAIASGYKFIITERDLLCDKEVFAKMLFDSGDIEDIEYTIYKQWFDEFNILTDLHVYIRASPDTSYTRLFKRARPEEVGKISLEYLQECAKYHDQFLMDKHNKYVFNGNETKYEYMDWIYEFDKLLYGEMTFKHIQDITTW
jgi:deoxyadenosine/deoxycytidine kinase